MVVAGERKFVPAEVLTTRTAGKVEAVSDVGSRRVADLFGRNEYCRAPRCRSAVVVLVRLRGWNCSGQADLHVLLAG